MRRDCTCRYIKRRYTIDFQFFSEMHQFRYNTTMQYGKKLINTINFMYNIIFQKNKTRARTFLFTFTSIRDVSFFINNRMELKK